MYGFLPLLILFLFFLFVLSPILWLIILPLALLFLFYFISLELLVFAFLNLVIIPKQLFYMLKHPVVRKNHALEHATINVLEERYGELPHVGGLADIRGFYIFSKDPFIGPDEIYEAAKIGLLRLKRGEKELAIHKRCGTSMAITSFILSLIIILVFLFGGLFNFWYVLAAVILVFLFSKPLGELGQRYITTDPNVEDIEIVGVHFSPFARYMGIPIPTGISRFFVETARVLKVKRIV